MLLKVNKRIKGKIEDYLVSNQVAYTMDGDFFELSLTEIQAFNLGRFYQQTLINYYNELSLQEKEKSGEDTRGFKP